MLCKVQHLWTSGASFTLNCYHHHTQMLVRTPSRTFKTILDSKGFTRGGGGLAMVACGSDVHHLVHHLQEAFQYVHQLWCKDDSSSSGGFAKFWDYLAA